jgi:hypothetical protein
VQTAEGELEIKVPQIRGAAEKFMSSVIPNGRTALPQPARRLRPRGARIEEIFDSEAVPGHALTVGCPAANRSAQHDSPPR